MKRIAILKTKYYTSKNAFRCVNCSDTNVVHMMSSDFANRYATQSKVITCLMFFNTFNFLTSKDKN